MEERAVDLQVALEQGLTSEEYARIVEILGRAPNFTEVGIFAVMWSEHCSYKSSIRYLKELPHEGSHVLVGAGEENAGALDIGGGKAVVFKIESHNHPSALEPYQGAATGIGGILRDIFSMGARPIAACDSLRFGDLSNPKQRHLFDGVVKGIAAYGNCFGVPTVAGEVVFDDAYSGNCLVNAMAVGIADADKLMPAHAVGIGNPVFILGATTGRDGMGGATFASVELSEQSAENRSSVQIGDPFLEKLLLEATLEIIDKGLAVGIQDMGAAGISCSSSEMSAAGGVGMTIDLDRVPLREDGMIPYEILLSESQERMLIVGIKGREEELRRVAEKWELHIERIGEVTEGGRLVCVERGSVVCDVPADSLVLGGGAPVYDRPAKKPDYIDVVSRWNADELAIEGDISKLIEEIISMPSISSKRWVYEQYDHQVGTNTVTKPGADAAVMRVKGLEAFLSISTDCNGRYCYLDPHMGGLQALAESARNVVATGAKPIGITNCLNFGNPERPESFWQFVEAVRGMSDGCRAYKIPVTGGNVSFYNESDTGAIYPTPVIGMLGIIEKQELIIPQGFIKGTVIYLLGDTDESEIGGSAIQKLLMKEPMGRPPTVDMTAEIAAADFIHRANSEQLIESCHDISDGGLAVALAESCIWGSIGARIELPAGCDAARFLFSESQARYLIGVKEDNSNHIMEIAKEFGVSITRLGVAIGDSLDISSPLSKISIKVNRLNSLYENKIPNIMRGEIEL